MHYRTLQTGSRRTSHGEDVREELENRPLPHIQGQRVHHPTAPRVAPLLLAHAKVLAAAVPAHGLARVVHAEELDEEGDGEAGEDEVPEHGHLAAREVFVLEHRHVLRGGQFAPLRDVAAAQLVRWGDGGDVADWSLGCCWCERVRVRAGPCECDSE